MASIIDRAAAKVIEKAQRRWPAGAPGGRGGEFAPANAGGGSGSGRAGRSHPAPPDMSRFSQSHPGVIRTTRYLRQMDDAAASGNLDFIRSMSTSRGNSYLRTVDDYRTALLTHYEPAARAARLRGTAPAAPTITGANMQNTALVAATRHVNRMRSIAENSDTPLEDLRSYMVGTGAAVTNTYFRQARAYHAALIQHFSDGEGASLASQAPARLRVVQQQPPAPTAAPQPAPAPRTRRTAQPAAQQPQPAKPLRDTVTHTGEGGIQYFRGDGRATDPGTRFGGSVGVMNSAFVDKGRSVTIDDVARSSAAYNPDRLSVAELGFIPRPNVPLSGSTVTREGVNQNGRVTPWATKAERKLADAYLSQPTSLQSRARDYASGSWRPETPEARARAAAAAQREDERLREAQRLYAAEEERRRASVPENFRPRNQPGNNIASFSGSVRANSFPPSSPFASEAGLRSLAGSLMADYGQGERFTVSASASGNTAEIRWRGSSNTEMTRQFTREQDGSISVYHAFFRAGERGSGAGKRFFRVAMGEYIAAGVKSVTVSANIDVGGYAWARFGYLPQTQGVWDELRSGLKAKLNRMHTSGQISDRAKAEVDSILNDTDKRALWRLSDYRGSDNKAIGKDLLLGTFWKGKINLNDAEQMRRFTAYVSQD